MRQQKTITGSKQGIVLIASILTPSIGPDNIDDENWIIIFTCVRFSICKETKLKEFHFKFIHRIAVTKKELHKCGIKKMMSVHNCWEQDSNYWLITWFKLDMYLISFIFYSLVVWLVTNPALYYPLDKNDEMVCLWEANIQKTSYIFPEEHLEYEGVCVVKLTKVNIVFNSA